MTVHVALIRALNVGGTAKMPMTMLKAIATDIGLKDVTTYIQSGNLVFRDRGKPDEIAAMLSTALGLVLGSPPEVFIRSTQELESIIADNPFDRYEPSKVLVSFFPRRLPDNALDGASAPDGEETVLHGREIYVHFPGGSGTSRLKLPVLKRGTARNINTIAKLAEMARTLEDHA
ncbi:DUF1697 domain-containing protein [Rhizobium halophytocola]|uniref:Uncharacterized protein (DUF1697 family) n=1 Tax=Rhizobium halophytocola TaxID=735519 RepID=A0ABS4DWU1_9HYPH|nr:DUF1697 domain-containing protein [Rhizobium halophytocola]MBP1850161.1 uncharacterized protein (DUF1697 family) [Rhizobium halophytocola]